MEDFKAHQPQFCLNLWRSVIFQSCSGKKAKRPWYLCGGSEVSCFPPVSNSMLEDFWSTLLGYKVISHSCIFPVWFELASLTVIINVSSHPVKLFLQMLGVFFPDFEHMLVLFYCLQLMKPFPFSLCVATVLTNSDHIMYKLVV